MKRKNKKLKFIINKDDKRKIMLLLVVIIIISFFLLKGPPTDIDDKFMKFLYKKDIIPVLIGTLISNIFTSNISSATETIVIPTLSLLLKTDLNKPINFNGISFNTKKIISSLINLLVSVFTIVIVFNNTNPM